MEGIIDTLQIAKIRYNSSYGKSLFVFKRKEVQHEKTRFYYYRNHIFACACGFRCRSCGAGGRSQDRQVSYRQIQSVFTIGFFNKDREKRNLGMLAGLSMLWVCDAVWVFGDEITEGMKTEIRFAEKLNIKVRYISENDLRKSEVKNDKVKQI